MERSPAQGRYDAALAVVMAAIALIEVFLAPRDAYPYAIVIPTAVLLAAPLALRRTRPLVALGLVLAVVVAQRLAFGELWDTGSTLAIPLVAVYSVAAYTPLRTAVLAFLSAWTLLSVCDIGDGGDSADVAFIGLINGAIWIAGRMTRRQRELAEANSAYARELESVQHLREEAATLEERSRIARELHDVVAHCVSTMVVQAEAGQALLDTDATRAGESFGSIQQTGRQALVELRRMLGLLRENAAEHAPQPTLAQLETLLAGIRESGLSVDLEVSGEPRPLPQGVDLSAYRIVQESLTNTLKHAGASRIVVRLGYLPEMLEVEVVDDGTAGRAHTNETGHGLRGMTERAQMHGGRLECGPRPGGGYAVRTRLPL